MAALSLTKALELFRAHLHIVRALTLLALLILLFFPMAISLHSYADHNTWGANNTSTSSWIVTSANATEDNTWNQSYNMTNGQIAMLKAHGAQFYPNGYIVTFGDPVNYTPEMRTALNITDANLAASYNMTETEVSFWQLPTWIQVSYLSGTLVAVACSMAMFPFVVRKLRPPLNNQNRSSILNYIVGNPGCTAPEVSRGKYINMGTVRYHIQRLESEGKIVLKKIGKFTRLYRNSSTYNDREMVIASHVRNATSRQLIGAILESPGMTNHNLSERFNLDKSTVYVHMQKLINDDIIVSQIDGKQKRYFINESARPSLERFIQAN